VVLVLLLGLLFLIVGSGVLGDSELLLEATGLAVLLIAITAATDDRRHRRAAALCGILATLLNGGTLYGFRPLGLELGPGASVLFSGYTTVLLLRGVVSSRRVTGDVLAGALAAYVMAGLTFAVAYGVILGRAPGAFQLTGGAPATFHDLVYFSFVTLLTIGFGDVTPVHPLARALTVFEGLFGVAYMTVVMASLVAAYLEVRRERGDPPA
jgi:hypothetical protein